MTNAKTSLIVETHPWLSQTLVCDGLLPWSKTYLPKQADLAEQIGRFRSAGVHHVSFTLAGGQETETDALLNLGAIRSQLGAAGIVIAHDSDAIRQAHSAGLFSASFHFQSATPFAVSLDLVDAFFEAGVRRSILAYNDANIFADGCHERRNSGLSARGRALVGRMDQVGMRVDLTHCGIRTTIDVLEMELNRPPLFSHSNARALFDHERNITDEQIRMAGKAGCYVGINGVGFFLGANSRNVAREMARHAAYIAARIGSERVGFGLDWMYLEGSDYEFFHTGRGSWPRGYPDPPWHFLQPEQLPDLVTALESEGFRRDEIAGLLGENYLRLVIGGAGSSV